MKNIIVIVVLSVFLNGCNAQNTEKKDNTQAENAITEIEPKVDYKVNKEYDEQGNLIRYDSTATYFYSNMSDNLDERDSIFRQFRSQFDQHDLFSQDPFFEDFFYSDSSFKSDFFTDDFYSKRFRNNMSQMERMFFEMDSLKNKYFNDFSKSKSLNEENE